MLSVEAVCLVSAMHFTNNFSILPELTVDLTDEISTTHSATGQREEKLQHQACIQ